MEWIRILLLSTSLVSVTDGDTLRLADGQGVRLQGFNTPEIFSPKCEREKQLGLQAKARMAQLLKQGGKLTINHGSCAYGRLCGTLTVNNVDVAEIMVREGLAEPMVCGSSCPRAKDWCHTP